MRHEGVVFKVYDKNFGKGVTYSIKLDGQPLYHRCGSKRYAGIAEPGNRIAFEADDNPDGKSTTVKSDPVLDMDKRGPAQTPSAGASGSYGQSGLQMRYQGALERAIHFVEVALENNAIKLPAKQAGILAAIEAAVDRYTAMFYEDTNTLGAVIREAEGGEEKPAPAKAAETDEDEESEDE